jgi:hypothetical protein
MEIIYHGLTNGAYSVNLLSVSHPMLDDMIEWCDDNFVDYLIDPQTLWLCTEAGAMAFKLRWEQ